ncbi:MAG: hypothetical protein ACI9UD_002184 [Glaciecola sp.]|jgi:hypothetical protein
MYNAVKTSPSHWSYRYFTLPLRHLGLLFLAPIFAKRKTEQNINYL